MSREAWKCLGWTCLGMGLAAQGPSEEGDRARSLQQLRELMTLPVKVATGTPTPWQQTPASVTVITGADLEAMGADTLDEALAMVPGLHVSQSGAIGATRFLFRGVVSYFNPQVLLLVDGVPRVSIVRGDRVGLVGTRIPAVMISHIEVIRGPGSAVYGEEAFAGVIHVHTRLAEGLEHPRVGALGGSFQSRGLWGEAVAESGKLRLGASAGRFESDGHRSILEADAQSGFDWLAQVLNLPVPPASRAPGPMETGGRFDDAQVDLAYGRLHLGLTQESRMDVGLGQGGASALDPEARIASHRTFLSVAFTPDLGKNWETQVSASAQRMTQETQRLFHLLPGGALFGAFPQGVLASPGYVEARRRLDGQATYQGIQNHRVRFGLGADRGEMIDIREIKNFDSAFQPFPGGMRDVSGTDEDWMPRRHRTSYHGFIQDEWTLGPGTVTTGVRYDEFSDVGHSWNPRLAWVGRLGAGWILKVLHGHAFRAPSHFELWGRNNPVTLGNPDLKPERLISSEVGLG